MKKEALTDRSRTFGKIRAQGADRVEISFHGGNDEGEFEEAALMSGHTTIREIEDDNFDYERDDSGEIVFSNIPGTTYQTGRRKPKTPEQTADDELYDELVEPLERQYHGFNGPPYVSGKIIWYVDTSEVRLVGYEEAYEDFDHPI